MKRSILTMSIFAMFSLFLAQPALSQESPPVEVTVDAGTLAEVDAEVSPDANKALDEAEAETPTSDAKEKAPPAGKNEIKDLNQVAPVAKGVIQHAQEGNWGLMIAGILMLIVFVIRKLWDYIPSSALPWMAAGMMVAISLIDGLLAGASIGSILLSALKISTMSGGLWGLVKPGFKKVFQTN